MTEDLPALVAPAGIEDVAVTDVVDAVNDAAGGPQDRRLGAEAATWWSCWSTRVRRTSDCAAITDADRPSARSSTAPATTSTRSSPATRTSPTTAGPGAGWVAETASDPASGGLRRPVRHQPQPAGSSSSTPSRVTWSRSARPSLAAQDYDADPRSRRSSTHAVVFADDSGNDVLGKIEGPFKRARRPTGQHREPWWRVDPGQPGRRDPALGDRSSRRARHRVHEPGWPACRHGRHRRR